MPDRTATIRPVQHADGSIKYVAEVFAIKTVSIAAGAFLSRELAEKFAARFGAVVKGVRCGERSPKSGGENAAPPDLAD